MLFRMPTASATPEATGVARSKVPKKQAPSLLTASFSAWTR